MTHSSAEAAPRDAGVPGHGAERARGPLAHTAVDRPARRGLPALAAGQKVQAARSLTRSIGAEHSFADSVSSSSSTTSSILSARTGRGMHSSVSRLRAELGGTWPFPHDAESFLPISVQRTLARSELNPYGALGQTVGAWFPCKLKEAPLSPPSTAPSQSQQGLDGPSRGPSPGLSIAMLARTRSWASVRGRRIRRMVRDFSLKPFFAPTHPTRSISLSLMLDVLRGD